MLLSKRNAVQLQHLYHSFFEIRSNEAVLTAYDAGWIVRKMVQKRIFAGMESMQIVEHAFFVELKLLNKRSLQGVGLDDDVFETIGVSKALLLISHEQYEEMLVQFDGIG